jgi:hypothetical protein
VSKGKRERDFLVIFFVNIVVCPLLSFYKLAKIANSKVVAFYKQFVNKEQKR